MSLSSGCKRLTATPLYSRVPEMIRENFEKYKFAKGIYDHVYSSHFTGRFVVIIFYETMLTLNFDGRTIFKSMWVAGG